MVKPLSWLLAAVGGGCSRGFAKAGAIRIFKVTRNSIKSCYRLAKAIEYVPGRFQNINSKRVLLNIDQVM